MIRLIEAAWRLRLGRVLPEEAATTCLFYAEDGNGRAVQAQIGDGLIARKLVGGAISVHSSRNDGFGFTQSLGTPHALSDWSMNQVDPIAAGEILLMATDGVSEDIDPGRLGDLASWVVDELATRKQPGRALTNELRNWPVPYHQDDKTLLVMWKP